VFVRRHFYNPTAADVEMRRPAPVALAVVAIVGWLLVAYFASQIMHMHASVYDALGRPESALQECGSQL
jgi:xanthosine utilization system XapX-like protein